MGEFFAWWNMDIWDILKDGWMPEYVGVPKMRGYLLYPETHYCFNEIQKSTTWMIRKHPEVG